MRKKNSDELKELVGRSNVAALDALILLAETGLDDNQRFQAAKHVIDRRRGRGEIVVEHVGSERREELERRQAAIDAVNTPEEWAKVLQFVIDSELFDREQRTLSVGSIVFTFDEIEAAGSVIPLKKEALQVVESPDAEATPPAYQPSPIPASYWCAASCNKQVTPDESSGRARCPSCGAVVEVRHIAPEPETVTTLSPDDRCVCLHARAVHESGLLECSTCRERGRRCEFFSEIGAAEAVKAAAKKTVKG
jgi:hypothetical protein